MTKATGAAVPDGPASAYEVVWPDGSVYVNRHEQTRLAFGEARMTAPRIGGTWRRVTGTETPKGT